MNTYKTCQGCPDRSITCHGTCPGYQAREQEKQQRYADKALKDSAYPTRIEYHKRQNRNARLVQLGHM